MARSPSTRTKNPTTSDPGDLVGGAGFTRVDGQAEAVLAGAAEEPAVVGDAEGGRLGAGDIDADDTAMITPAT